MHKLLIIFVLIPVVAFSDNFTDSLKTQLSGASDLKKVEILQTITGHYLFENVDSCLKYGTLVVELANENRDLGQEAKACKRMGYASYRIGNYDKSINYYQRALEIFFELAQYLDVSVTTNLIGDAYSQKSDYSKAIDCFVKVEQSCDTLIKSKDITSQVSVKRLLAILYTNWGILYYRLDSLQKPLDYFNKALHYAEEISDSNRIAASYSNIGMIYKNKDEFERAFTAYSKSLRISQKIGSRDYEKATLNNIASMYVKQRQLDSAMVYYNKAYDIVQETKDKYGLSIVVRNIGQIYFEIGNVTQALKYTDLALDYAKEAGSPLEIYTSYKLLSDIYKTKGNFTKALEYYTMYATLMDSVLGIETREKVAELQTRFETEKKEKENISLRKNNEIQQLQLSSKNLQITFLTTGIILFIALSIIIFILYRKRHKAYKQLVKKNLDLIHFENKTLLQPVPKTNDKSNYENGEQTKNLAMIFDTYMKKEKPFLYSEICYDEVCKKLNTNRTYLSKAINKSYKKSFLEVINYFRIKEASLYLSNPKYNHISIEGIGQMTGFNYKAAFHSNFKKQVGITPSFFRKNSQA